MIYHENKYVILKNNGFSKVINKLVFMQEIMFDSKSHLEDKTYLIFENISSKKHDVQFAFLLYTLYIITE